MNGANDNLAQLAGGRRTELSPGSGLGVVFSAHCWPFSLPVLCIRSCQAPALTGGIKHRLPGVRLLIARVWTCWCVMCDHVIHLPRPRHTPMQIIVKINPWRPNVLWVVGFVSIQVFFNHDFWSPPLRLSTQYLVGKLLDGWISFNVRINIYKFQSQCCCLEWSKI